MHQIFGLHQICTSRRESEARLGSLCLFWAPKYYTNPRFSP
jgi:hypothetical protein